MSIKFAMKVTTSKESNNDDFISKGIGTLSSTTSHIEVNDKVPLVVHTTWTHGMALNRAFDTFFDRFSGDPLMGKMYTSRWPVEMNLDKIDITMYNDEFVGDDGNVYPAIEASVSKINTSMFGRPAQAAESYRIDGSIGKRSVVEGSDVYTVEGGDTPTPDNTSIILSKLRHKDTSDLVKYTHQHFLNCGIVNDYVTDSGRSHIFAGTPLEFSTYVYSWLDDMSEYFEEEYGWDDELWPDVDENNLAAIVKYSAHDDESVCVEDLFGADTPKLNRVLKMQKDDLEDKSPFRDIIPREDGPFNPDGEPLASLRVVMVLLMITYARYMNRHCIFTVACDQFQGKEVVDVINAIPELHELMIGWVTIIVAEKAIT